MNSGIFYLYVYEFKTGKLVIHILKLMKLEIQLFDMFIKEKNLINNISSFSER